PRPRRASRGRKAVPQFRLFLNTVLYSTSRCLLPPPWPPSHPHLPEQLASPKLTSKAAAITSNFPLYRFPPQPENLPSHSGGRMDSDGDDDVVRFGIPVLIALFDSGGDLPPFQHGLGATGRGTARLIAEDAWEPCTFQNAAAECVGNALLLVGGTGAVTLHSGGLTLCAAPRGSALLWIPASECDDTLITEFRLKGISDASKTLAVGGVFSLRLAGGTGAAICTRRAEGSEELELFVDGGIGGSVAWFNIDGIVDASLSFGDAVTKAEAALAPLEAEPEAADGAAVAVAVVASTQPPSSAAGPAKGLSPPQWLRRGRSPPKTDAAATAPAIAATAAVTAAAPAVAAIAKEADKGAPPPPPPPAMPSPAAMCERGRGTVSEFSCEFGDGPLGVTLRLGAGGGVEFFGIHEGGQGARAGIVDDDLLLQIGDAFIGAEQPLSEGEWQGLIARIREGERPLAMRVGRRRGGGTGGADDTGTAAGKQISSAVSVGAAVAAPAKTPASAVPSLPPPPPVTRAASVGSSTSGRDRGPVLKQGPVKVVRAGALWNNVSPRQLFLYQEELMLRPPPPGGSAGGGNGGAFGTGGFAACVSSLDDGSDDGDSSGGGGRAGNGGGSGGGGVGALLASVDEGDTAVPLATAKVRLPRPGASAALSPRRRSAAPEEQYSFELLSPFGSLLLCFPTAEAKAAWVAALGEAIMTALQGHMAGPMALGSRHQVVLGTLHSAVVCG
ncbi:unnamed protein product, partial [Phaeothamnion confervicola]